jgi:beta-galactosidase
LPGTSSPAITGNLTSNQMDLTIKFPDQDVEECQLDQSTQSIRILAVNDALSLYTWILGDANKQYVVCGPSFVQDLQEANGNVYLKIERPYGQPSCGQVAVYGDKSWHLAVASDPSVDSQPAPTLNSWQMMTTSEPTSDYDDSKWMQTPDPQQMGADGDYGCFAWYRTTIDLPHDGNGTLHLNGADEIRVYINGKYVNGDRDVNASFVSGPNTIAVLVSHHGRDKNFCYMGSLAHQDDKGLYGPVSLDMDGQHIDVKGWHMRGGLGGQPAEITSWGDLGETHNLPTFYQATFATKPPVQVGPHPILRVKFAGLSRGTMWVNGHNLGQFPEKIHIDSLYIPECWLKDGDNELTVFDTHGSDPSKVQLEVEQLSSREVIPVSRPINPNTPMVTPSNLATDPGQQ